ncbi:MAG TPA: (4Fe-4S)-binding protein [Chitinophagaceae bacterium]|nr:(4Fe-4S)-binding protein [Chitinophagaceae bacterium]
MAQTTYKYSNGQVTIVWQPRLCIHSGNCFRGLPEVFKPSEKPWISPEGSATGKIIDQVKKCPSGALSFFMDEGKKMDEV